MKKFQTVFAIALLLMLIAGMARPTSAAPLRQSGPTTWTVLVGAQGEMQQTDHGPAGAWQFMRFYPDSITINVGDTIVFKDNSLDMHNVYFLAGPPPNLSPYQIQGQQAVANPAVFFPQGGSSFDGSATASSGALGVSLPNSPTQYQLTFTKAGSYNYVCTFHGGPDPTTHQLSGMVGKVIVQDAGSAYPKTQAQIDTDAQAMIAADTQKAIADEPNFKQTSNRPGPSGTTIYGVNIGAMDMASYGDYMRFAPDNLTIHAGDTVEWTFKSGPHNVLFTSGGPDVKLFTNTLLSQPLLINPQVLRPAGSKSYDGTGLVGSGVPQRGGDPNAAPQTYSLTFTKPGTYEYVCTFHDEMGMVGHVTVLAAQGGGSAMPLMPQTGSGGLDLSTWALIAAAFVLIVGLMFLALRVQRGRKQAS